MSDRNGHSTNSVRGAVGWGPAAKPNWLSSGHRRRPRGTYTVYLHFAKLNQVEPSERVRDVTIQGQTAIQELDVVAQAGECRRVLTKKIEKARASVKLSIGLVPSANSKYLAVWSAIEIVRNE